MFSGFTSPMVLIVPVTSHYDPICDIADNAFLCMWLHGGLVDEKCSNYHNHVHWCDMAPSDVSITEMVS